MFKKISDEEFNGFGSMFRPGDWFFVEGTDLVDVLVSWGTGDDNTGETVKMSPCHAGNYLGDSVGKTFEADGKKLAYHLWEDYRTKLKAGKNRVVCFRPRALTVEELGLYRKAVGEYAGENYNKWELFWFGVWGAINKFTPFGGLAGLVRNPAYKKDSVVCSQLAVLCWKYVLRIYTPIVKDKPIENMTPEELFDRILRVSDFVFDTNS
jgi:hypothetical protein